MATPPQGPGAPLPVGTRAPDFALSSAPDRTVSLADFRGRPVILAFYPADWSPVCGDQMALYNPVTAGFGSPCLRTSSPRERSRAAMAPTARPTASASGRCS